MSKKVALILTALALAVVYASFFTDWLRPAPIQIVAQSRPTGSGAEVDPISFRLNGEYEVNSIEVVPVATNSTTVAAAPTAPALPVWKLDRVSNAPPVKFFLYGETVPGLHCPKTKPAADPLLPGMAYRLTVKAGRSSGVLDFHTPTRPEAN